MAEARSIRDARSIRRRNGRGEIHQRGVSSWCEGEPREAPQNTRVKFYEDIYEAWSRQLPNCLVPLLPPGSVTASITRIILLEKSQSPTLQVVDGEASPSHEYQIHFMLVVSLFGHMRICHVIYIGRLIVHCKELDLKTSQLFLQPPSQLSGVPTLDPEPSQLFHTSNTAHAPIHIVAKFEVLSAEM
ncbi:hypothetical protein Sjap_026169 [Stephania japonica]|uniref:Uncharacterized protein n=1 Tax=Stephania japonica TaxID=461633 RepID=A0AAP0E666_9MAGN